MRLGMTDGNADGLTLGMADGNADGLMLGNAEGISLGWDDGLLLGVSDGIADGLMLGIAEGILLGNAEGILLGWDEGLLLGRDEGILLGRDEGFWLGRDEGFLLGLDDGRVLGIAEAGQVDDVVGDVTLKVPIVVGNEVQYDAGTLVFVLSQLVSVFIANKRALAVPDSRGPVYRVFRVCWIDTAVVPSAKPDGRKELLVSTVVPIPIYPLPSTFTEATNRGVVEAD
jgi:hypothetical protein